MVLHIPVSVAALIKISAAHLVWCFYIVLNISNCYFSVAWFSTFGLVIWHLSGLLSPYSRSQMKLFC